MIQGSMKFNVVIGNPPYNHGLDIGFIHLGFNIAQDNVIMIVPAKLHSAEARQSNQSDITYETLRNDTIHHIKTIVFYPCCKDLFKIKEASGIMYYNIDKHNTYKDVEVINKSTSYQILNSKMVRPIYSELEGPLPLLNQGYRLLKYIKNNKDLAIRFNLSFDVNLNKKYKVITVTKAPALNDSNKPESQVFVTSILRISTEFNNEPDRQVVFTSDDLSECESYVTYMYTRFVRFMYFINASKLSNPFTDFSWRFVPIITDKDGNPRFDRKYSDDYVNNYFGLTAEHIEVINSIIKERVEINEHS